MATTSGGAPGREVVQHRFDSAGELHDHALGNLLIVAITELLGDQVAALDLIGELLRAHGRVLPMSIVPLDIEAEVAGFDPTRSVGCRARCAARSRLPPHAAGWCRSPSCRTTRRPAHRRSTAILDAEWVVLGPGSWFSSVLPHLLVPELAKALISTPARKIVALNLAPQPGETADFSPEAHLDVLAAHAPELQGRRGAR